MTVDEFDVFISHAWEDKDDFVRPLAERLVERGLTVWYDEMSLDIGDSLRTSIDSGLAQSRFGVVVLSTAFFRKDWPAWELNGLVQKAMGEGRKVVLPVWHDVSRAEVAEYSLPLADLVAANSGDGVEAVADGIVRVVTGTSSAREVASTVREQSEQRLISSAKALISDPTQVVALNDLVDAVARETYASLSEQYAENLTNASQLDSPAVLAAYRHAVRGLTRLCAVGANLGHPAHQPTWERAVAIVARDPGKAAPQRLSEAVWQYPVAVLLYASGVAALQRSRLDFVVKLLTGIQVETQGERGTIGLVGALRWDTIGQFVKGAHETQYKTPLSEDLFMALPDLVMEYFIDEAEFERTFDLFEYALSLGHLAVERERKYRWVPPARYMWKNHFDAERLDRLAGQLADLGAVDMFFGGDKDEYGVACEAIKTAASGPGYF